ncbi:hypothetical protein C8R46DRAFT_268450 [Mycena filopes]|nr:hypothetical protein C8R46DRAFT_268450 [Mycena filopes]
MGRLMEPPLSLDYLVSLQNDPIPASEVHIAHSWIRDAEQESARVAEEIQTLASRRLELQRSLQIYRRAVAPHKSLPVEILREIFGFCGGTADLNDIDALLSNDIRPVLCGVCSRWRAVALVTHELWSDVRVELGRRSAARLLTALELWLSRAGSHPVILDLSGAQNLRNESPERARIDQLIVAYSGQFRSLSVEPLPLRSTLFTTSPGFLDQLETLTLGISYINRASGGEVGPPLSAGLVAPKLRSLTLSWAYGPTRLARLRFPWSTLTRLIITEMFPPISNYYLVLEECKSLITASFSLWDYIPIPPAPRDFSLPSLRELYLDIDFFGNAIRFVDRITLDSLTSLEIDIQGDPNESVTSVRSFPSLLKLHCHSGAYGANKIAPSEGSLLLHACPAAVAVSVEFSPSQSTLDEIENGTLLPNAQQLGLSAVDPAVLLRILKTRRESSVYSTIVRAAGRPLRNCTAEEVDSFNHLLDMGVFASANTWEVDTNALENRARTERARGIGYYGINSLTNY